MAVTKGQAAVRRPGGSQNQGGDNKAGDTGTTRGREGPYNPQRPRLAMDQFAPVVTIREIMPLALDLARRRQALRFGSGSGAEEEAFLPSLPTGDD
jgi:hypothetical protein